MILPALPADAAPPPAIVAPPPPTASVPAATGAGWHVQSAVESLAQDSREYSLQNNVPLDEAMRRLRAQEESVAATDRIRDTYRARLAGIAMEHQPTYRIVVLLTGSEPVPDEAVEAGGMTVPIVFHTGAAVTEEQLLAAVRDRRRDIANALPTSFGLGIDPRTAELVVTLKTIREPGGAPALSARLSQVAGVPVRVRELEQRQANFAATGGARLEGVDQGRRYSCTSGFVVTDLARNGIVTAAHCPYTLSYRDPARGLVPLSFAGAWGARFQDVQVQVSDEPLAPLFFADTAKSAARPVTSWRNRTSTRAGDVVCHRGEKTGYSCSQIELTDYAPPGDLCGGPCEPVWVTVAGPSCGSGDSGGPVFNGTIAFGILKGGSYRRDGTCNFYYYMSTDYLPEGWSLSHE